MKKTSMLNPVKDCGYIQCCSSSSPSLLKGLAILSDTTVQRSAVNREDLKPYWKSQYIYLGDQKLTKKANILFQCTKKEINN